MSPGDVPAVADDVGGLLRLAEVARHPVRALHQQEPLPTEQRALSRDRIHDFGGHPRKRMSDRARARSALTLAPVVDVGHVDSHDWRHFGAAIPFEQVDPELRSECRRGGFAQFFGADNRVPQVLELIGVAFADVRRTESRRADHEGPAITRGQLADGPGIHRIRVINDPETADDRKPQRPGKPERIKKGSMPTSTSFEVS